MGQRTKRVGGEAEKKQKKKKTKKQKNTRAEKIEKEAENDKIDVSNKWKRGEKNGRKGN